MIKKDLQLKKAVITTGGRPNVPPIEGLKVIHYYTSDNIFNLNELLAEIMIVRSGPIGCELG